MNEKIHIIIVANKDATKVISLLIRQIRNISKLLIKRWKKTKDFLEFIL